MPCAHFDRFDIVEAHLIFERDWNSGGWLQERSSNQRRHEATHVQTARMGYRPGALLMNEGFRGLSRNGRAIYLNLRRRYGLRHTKG